MKPEPELIRSLVTFLEVEGLEEVCYETGGMRIKVRKEPSVNSFSFVEVAAPQSVSVVRLPAPADPAPAPARPRKAENRCDLLSPMSGIFYRSPSPGTEPFVKVEDEVDRGQTIGLVEAMKTFNEVGAELPGRIIEFYVQDAGAVQGGQPILAIEPSEVEV